MGHLSLIPRCVPAVQIIDSARNPLRGTSHTYSTQNSNQSGNWEGLTVKKHGGRLYTLQTSPREACEPPRGRVEAHDGVARWTDFPPATTQRRVLALM